MPSSDSKNSYEPSTSKTPVYLADRTTIPIRWQTHLVLLATAIVSWTTMIIGIALSMRNMFGGPPPDDSGTVFLGLSMLISIGGISYIAMSRFRRSLATQSGIQRFVLLLLVLANVFPLAQTVVGILSYGAGP